MTPITRGQRLAGSREGSALVLLATAFGGWGLIVLAFPAARSAVIPTAYAVPVLLMAALILSIRILLVGSQPLSYGLLIAGISFVGGGVAFDIFATVIHSPNLEREANPVARLLLDSGHSTGFVYLYGGFCQIAFASLICLLWGGLLRHRKSIVDSVRKSTSLLQLLKALTGGARLTWRQWICPLKLSDLPDFSYYVWIMASMWVPGAAYRWYLGLEWFGFSPVDSIYVGIIAMLTGIVAYVIWVHREVQRANRELQTNGQSACAIAE